MTSRREFGVALLLASAARSRAAAPARLPRVAIVFNSAPPSELGSPPSYWGARAIDDGLRERGWIDGKTVQLVWRSAEQHIDRFPAIMAELVSLPVDVIVVSGSAMARAAREKTRTIPIVLGSSTVAVEEGLAESYARPGGNITGLSSTAAQTLNGKRLAILKQLAPKVARIAFLAPSYVPNRFTPHTQDALRALGLEGVHVHADFVQDLAGAFAKAIRQGADGMIVTAAAPNWLRDNQRATHALAIEHRLPAVYAPLSAAESGGLAAYGSDDVEVYRRVGHYVDRILRGASPATLPIEQANTFYLHLNRGAAKAIGLTIPQALLAQADRVFE